MNESDDHTRDVEIDEAPEGPAEPPPTGEAGPADEGFHASFEGELVDVGEPTDEPDTPLPPEEDEDSPLPPEEGARRAADRLHRAMSIAVKMGLVITSTTGPGHGRNSYHYRKPYRVVVIRGRRYQLGRAADIAKAGNPGSLYRKYFRRIGSMRPTELFYTPMGYSWKNGQKVNWVVSDHHDHVHVAF